MTSADQSDPEQNRLDRELAEILDQAERRPISFQDRVAQRRNSRQSKSYLQHASHCDTARSFVTRIAETMMRIPLLTALLLALVAVWLSANYQLAATVVALAAAAFIFIPFLRRPQTEPSSYHRRWRGREISSFPSSSGQSNDLVGSIRSWVASNRNRIGR
jgi:Flp pilus assembly protein TadB